MSEQERRATAPVDEVRHRHMSDVAATTVEIVIPVFNEERALPGCLETLTEWLGREVPFSWTVTVVDNASTDRTPEVARELAARLDGVSVLRLEEKGRGRALRAAWSRSEADVVAYMDVDLSTGLDAFIPLVGPLALGYADVAVGSRLAAGARTVRGPRRTFVSRSYNRLIRAVHGTRVSDAQCGFKAVRVSTVRPLLEHVRDDGWFFDTELILLAEHNGLRVHEVPVDWVEDVDSRVDVLATALTDIRGLLRVARAKADGSASVAGIPRRPAPRPTHPDAVVGDTAPRSSSTIAGFVVVGVLSTLVHLALFTVLRTWWPPLAANLAALLISTVVNTELNRRFTFRAGGSSRVRSQLRGLLLLGLYTAITSGALLLAPTGSRIGELVALVVGAVVGTAVRYVLMRVWVFRS